MNPFDLEAQRLEARKTHAKMEAARQAEHEKYVAGKQLEARRSEAREAKKHKAAKVQARALANQEAPILPMDDSLREEDDVCHNEARGLPSARPMLTLCLDRRTSLAGMTV